MSTFPLVATRSQGLFFLFSLRSHENSMGQGSCQQAGMVYAIHMSDNHRLFCKLPLSAPSNSREAISPQGTPPQDGPDTHDGQSMPPHPETQ